MDEPSFADFEACIQGDGEAWARVVEQCEPVIRRAVRAVLIGNGSRTEPEEVEDLVQETFLNLLEDGCRRLRAFDPAKSRLGGWIALLARRQALNAVKRRRILTVALETVAELATPPPAEDPPDLHLPDGLLSPGERRVIESLYVEDLSVGELEKEFGISRQAVWTAKSKGLKKLRAYFHGRGQEGRKQA